MRRAPRSRTSAAGGARKHGITEPAFYRRRWRRGGLKVSETRRLKALEEEENRRLQQVVAEQALDNWVLKGLLG